MSKGQETKAVILNAALGLASTDGIEGLSIGRLAQMTGMSKSGLFAHFGSREELQRSVLEHGRERFIAEVISPALKAPRGLPRVTALYNNYRDWINGSHGLPGGCPILLAALELADRDGSLHRQHVKTLDALLNFIEESAVRAVRESHLSPNADTRQFAVELQGIMLTFYLQKRLLNSDDAAKRADIAFESLVSRFATKQTG